jgi:hypothetical protein
MTEPTYKIVRHFHSGPEVIMTGLTLDEAREHCQDPETSARTCTTYEGQLLTRTRGFWFDGYTEE